MAGYYSSSAEVDWKLIPFACPLKIHPKDCDTYRPGPSKEKEFTDWSVINVEPAAASPEISSKSEEIEPVAEPDSTASNITSDHKQENDEEVHASGSRSVEDWTLINAEAPVFDQCRKETSKTYNNLDDVKPGPSKGRFSPSLQNTVDPTRTHLHKDTVVGYVDNQHMQGSSQVTSSLNEHQETCFETDRELPGSSKTTKVATILKKSSTRMDPESDAADWNLFRTEESTNLPRFDPDCWSSGSTEDFNHESHEKESKKHVHFDSTSECDLFNKEPHIQYRFPKEKCAAAACGQTLCRLRDSASDKTKFDLQTEQASRILEKARETLGFADEKGEIQPIIPFDGNKNMSANEDSKDGSRYNQGVGQSEGDFTDLEKKPSYQKRTKSECPQSLESASDSPNHPDLLNMESLAAKKSCYIDNSTISSPNAQETGESEQRKLGCRKTQSHTEKMVALFTKLQSQQTSQPLPLEKTKRRMHTEGVTAERARDLEEKIAKVADKTSLASHPVQKVEKILSPAQTEPQKPDELHHANIHSVKAILLVLHSMQSMLMRMSKMANSTDVDGCTYIDDHDPATWKTFLKPHNKRPPHKVSCPKDSGMMADGLFAYIIAHQVVGQALKKISEFYPECAEEAHTESTVGKENPVKDSVPTVLALTAMKETLKDLEGCGTGKSYASTAVETSNSLASVTVESDPEEDQRDESNAESEEISLSLIDDLLETNNSDEQEDAEQVVADVLRDATLSKQSDSIQEELKQMSFELVSRTMKEALGVLMTSRASKTTRNMPFDKHHAATPMNSEETHGESVAQAETNRDEQNQNSPPAESSSKRDDQSVAFFMQSISDEVHGLIRKLFNHLQSVESKEELSAILSATKADSSISLDTTVLNGAPMCTTPESDVSSVDAIIEIHPTSLTILAGKSSPVQKAHMHRRDTAADLGNVKQQLEILSMKTEPQIECEENLSQPLTLPGKFELAPSTSAQEFPPEGAQVWCPLNIDVMPFGNGIYETSNESTKCLNSRSQSTDSSIERLLQIHTAATHSRVSSRDNLLTYDEDSQGSSPYTTPSTLLSLQTSGDSRDQMFSSTGFGNVQSVRSEDLLHIPPGRLLMAGGNHPEHVQQADINRPTCSSPTKKSDYHCQQALHRGAFVSKSERERVCEGKRQQGSCNCAGPCYHQQRGSKFNVGNAARHKQSASEPKLDFYRRTKVLPCPQVRRNFLENSDSTNSDWTLVGWFPPQPTIEALIDTSGYEIDHENISTEGEGVTPQETEVFGTVAAPSQQNIVNWPPREESDHVNECLIKPVSTQPSEHNCRDDSSLSDNPRTLAPVNWNKDPHVFIERACTALEVDAEQRNTNDDDPSETFRETSQSGRVNPTPYKSKRTTDELSEEHYIGSSGCLHYPHSAAQILSSTALTSSDQLLSENAPLSDRSHYCQQTGQPDPFTGDSGFFDQNTSAPSRMSNSGQQNGASMSSHQICDYARSGNISPASTCPNCLNALNMSCAPTSQPLLPTSCSHSCFCQPPLFHEISSGMDTGPFPCAIKENLAECSSGEISSSDKISSCKCSAVHGQNPNKNINGIGRMRHRYEPYPNTTGPKQSDSGGTSVDVLQHDLLQMNDRMERRMEAIKSTVTALCDAMHYPYAERRNSTALEIKEALSFQSHASNGFSSRVQHCSAHSCDPCSVHSPENELGLASSYGSDHHPSTRDFAVERTASTSVDLETLSVSKCCSVASNRSRNPRLSISAPSSKWRHHYHRLPGMMRDEQRCRSFHETACSGVCNLAVDPVSASYVVPGAARLPAPCHCQSYGGHCCSLIKTGSCCVDTGFGTNLEDFSKAIGTSVSRSSASEFRAVSKTSVHGCVHATCRCSSGLNEISLPNHKVSEAGFLAPRGISQAVCKCMYERRSGRTDETREGDGCGKTSTCASHCDSARGSFIDVDGFAEISRRQINPVLAERVQKLMRKGSSSKTAITSKCANSALQECECTTESLEFSKVNDQLANDDVNAETHKTASAKGSDVQLSNQCSPRAVPSTEVDAAFRVIHSILNSCDSGSANAPVCMRVTSSNVDEFVTSPSSHFKFELSELSGEIPSSGLPSHTDKSKDKNDCCITSSVSRDSPGVNSSVGNSASRAQLTQQNSLINSTGQLNHGSDNEKNCASNPNKFSAFFVSVDQENGPPAFFVQSVPQTSKMKEFTDIACQVSNENVCSNLQGIPGWYESDSSEVSLARSVSLSKMIDLDGDFYGNPEDLACRDKAGGHDAEDIYLTPVKNGSAFTRVGQVSAKNQINVGGSRSHRGSPLSRTTVTNSSVLEGVCEISHSGCEACAKKATGCSSRSRLKVTSSKSLTCENHLSQGPLSRRSSSTCTGLDPLQSPKKDLDIHSDSHKNKNTDGRRYDENTGQVSPCVGVKVMRTGNAAPYYAVASASDSVDPLHSSAWAADSLHVAQVEDHPEPTMLRAASRKSSHVDPSNTDVNTGIIGEDSCGKQNIQNNMDDAQHSRKSVCVIPHLSEKSVSTGFIQDSAISADCHWMSSPSDTGSSSSKASCLRNRQSGATEYDPSWNSKTTASSEALLPPGPALGAPDGEDICRTREATSDRGAAPRVGAFGGECSHDRKRLQQSNHSPRCRPKLSQTVLEPHEVEPPFSFSLRGSSSLQSVSLAPQPNYPLGKLHSKASSRVDPFMDLYDPTWLNGLDPQRISCTDPSSLPKPLPIALYDASYIPRTMKSGTGVDLTKGLDDILGGSTSVDTKAGAVDNSDLLIRSISEELCSSPSRRERSKEDSWAALQKMNLSSRATRMVLESRLKSLHRLLKKMESSENLILSDMPNKKQSPASKTSSRETTSSISASHPAKGDNWLKTCNSEELVQVVDHQLKELKDSAIMDPKPWNKNTDEEEL